MVGYTMDDKQDFFMMITKSGSTGTYSMAKYELNSESETKKMSEKETIILGNEPVGQLVADREFTAISFPNGKSLTTATTSERRGKIVIYKTDDLKEVVDTVVGVQTANEPGV